MKKTYKLMGNENNGFQIFEATGEEIVIPGFEEIRFIVHPKPDGWVVSEMTTGLRIMPADTRSLAIELAKSILDSYSKEHVHEVFERAKSTMNEWGAYPLNP